MQIPHIIIIQSSYSDPELSRRRLEIMRHSCIPSLAFQTRKPVVHVATNPYDPHTPERIDLLRSTGCEVYPVYRDKWKLYGENWELPGGRKVVSRMDDDDVLAKDFCERTFKAAPESGDHALIWPVGYVFWRETCFLLNHPGNQFVSIVTDRQTDPHSERHWMYCKRWPTVVVGRDCGWIWVRHGDSATSTLKRYRTKPLRGIDSGRIPINLRAIMRSIEESGVASGSYKQHRNAAQLKYVLQENANAP